MSLAIRSVAKSYAGMSAPALRGVDLDVVPGTISALIGPNGAGKTTLVSIVMGLTELDAGTVEFDGVLGWAYAELLAEPSSAD